MITVGAFEAKTKFSELLDRVERGEEVVVTRHGKAVARIVPDERPDADAARKARAAEALTRIAALREHLRAKGVSFTLDEILSARDEGRR
jgi:prevent-host-death family protein